MRTFSSFCVAAIVLTYQFTASSSSCEVETETLCVNKVNEDGFGDLNNQYAWSMATFQGSVYVATLNADGGLGSMAFFFLGMEFPSNGAQIFRGDRDEQSATGWTWTRVVTDGLNDAENYGVRSFEVVGDWLYAVTANHVTGFEVWRTNDGTTWEVVVTDGFGDFDNTSGRGLGAYKGHIYVGAENRKTGAKIYRRAIDEATGDFADESEWEQVVNDGLGNTNNYWFADFVEYNGYLYTGTLNVMQGMELHRTLDGVTWEKIFDGGNGNRDDQAAMKLAVYNEKLYIGTMNFNVLSGGASLLANRDKGNGQNFQTVFSGGNGNRMNAYVWAMQVYDNRLYIGTFNMFGEFDMFSCVECEKTGMLVETRTGFDNEFQYGIRSMAVYEDKLMIGSATARGDHGCQVYEATSLQSASAHGVGALLMHGTGGVEGGVAMAEQPMSQIAVIASLLAIGAIFLCIGLCIGQKVSVKQKSVVVDISHV